MKTLDFFRLPEKNRTIFLVVLDGKESSIKYRQRWLCILNFFRGPFFLLNCCFNLDGDSRFLLNVSSSCPQYLIRYLNLPAQNALLASKFKFFFDNYCFKMILVMTQLSFIYGTAACKLFCLGFVLIHQVFT